MKNRSLVILGCIFVSIGVHAKEPINLDTAKQKVIRYHDSGEYEKEITNVTAKAIVYLATELAKPKHQQKQTAIVLDIDETSLSNYDNMVQANFGGTLDQMRIDEMRANDPVIRPILKLYKFAKEKGIAVFFVTGRHEEERESTIANLQKAGFSNWDGLIFKPAAYQGKSASIYKTAMRKSLTEKGYDILLNIGDQQSDLIGGYADKTFKLPNPFYVIP